MPKIARGFQSTLPARGATFRNLVYKHNYRMISIHAPRTGSDIKRTVIIALKPISIHAPRTGSDESKYNTLWDTIDFNPRSPHGERPIHALSAEPALKRFQSTLPARGATGAAPNKTSCCRIFQSTLPARGATFVARRLLSVSSISIHAPRTGSDLLRRQPQTDGVLLISIHAPRTGSDAAINVTFQIVPISIHAPRTGSDCRTSGRSSRTVPFQSTLPARGATQYLQSILRRMPHFNPRSPHGERPDRLHWRRSREPISIHAPRTGSDVTANLDSILAYIISIHAPRTGSDILYYFTTRPDIHFNPRSPHGERHSPHDVK